MIRVTARIALDEAEIAEDFLRASGPGGQNVQKVESAVQLRFAAMASPNLSDAVKARLAVLAGRRMTKDGVLVITAQRHRTRERNREDALDRLLALIREAATPPPPPRKATKPTLGSRKRRLESKTRRGATKRLRSTRPGEE
jgi:ribosome-associated protein